VQEIDCLDTNVHLQNDPSPGSINLIVSWKDEYEEPLYLLTNIEPAREAIYWYQKRFTIETFFSDQKSRGFHLHKSHITSGYLTWCSQKRMS